MSKVSNEKCLDSLELVNEAARNFSAFYPLKSFIACNNLSGMESLDFDQAMEKACEIYGSHGYLPLGEYRAMYETGRINPIDFREAFARLKESDDRSLTAQRKDDSVALSRTWTELADRTFSTDLGNRLNEIMLRWLASHFDKNQAQWKVLKDMALFQRWRKLAVHDLTLSIAGAKDWKKHLLSLPESSDDALRFMLDEIGVPPSASGAFLARHLTRLPGWSAYLKWHSERGGMPCALVDYLCIRLFYELHLMKSDLSPTAKSWEQLMRADSLISSYEAMGDSRPDDYSGVWQEAYEINYRNALLKDIASSMNGKTFETVPADCHIVFCIDCRSEPVRRHLEKLGSYATYGYAGFFGFPMKYVQACSDNTVDLCPVLLEPEKVVKENLERNKNNLRLSGQNLIGSALLLRKKLKSSVLSAFALVEMAGLWSSIPLAAKTFFPVQTEKMLSMIKERIFLGDTGELDTSQFTLEEKVSLANGNLAAMALSDLSAPLIVLCGHISQSQNNPYASSLDCGACGGNPGGASARLAANVFNDGEVREKLAEQGICIGEDTFFIAAQHNTTTDSFEIFDQERVPQSHRKLLQRLKEDLAEAGRRAADERKRFLPQEEVIGLTSAEARATDWAQVAPEWGLARNAAFIVAPRTLTKKIDLGGRTFLHGYDWDKDLEGTVLETIMTAPMVVAQWINNQYYLSTVDNHVFGSGSKTLHNVVGDFAVMSGQESDLRLGLPLESVFQNESTRFHEPMRLMVLIRAPLAKIDKVLEKHENVRNLVTNRWIRLVALDPEDESFYQADRAFEWRKLMEKEKLFVSVKQV
ncbi:DUF2309 family protein [bacterium]|nr:DUF2309 family protein [bacterium]